jgi:spore protease
LKKKGNIFIIMNRTDLAHEMGTKPTGNYLTLFCEERNATEDTNKLIKALNEILPDLEGSKILVAGLGNENITPDSLGVRTAGKILATAHFKSTNEHEVNQEFHELGLREVYVIQPGVMAQTGLESAVQLKLIANGIKPDFLIVIDSLACSAYERLATTIQVTDTGIAPGSGVKNERKEISHDVFGVPVIAIGVPTVIDHQEMMLVPRDIDLIVAHYAKVISGAVNLTLNPALDESEIEQLLM